jgi:hypothetical protein
MAVIVTILTSARQVPGFRTNLLAPSSTLKMEAVLSFETFVSVNQAVT